MDLALPLHMTPSRIFTVLLVLGALSASACRNTYNGVKADTKNAVHKTGHGVERTGEKMENVGK
jgi:predicted small secreted protein